MNPENKHFTPNPSDDTNEAMFDVAAANVEHLEWRVGGKPPTERALGLNESRAREHQEAVDSAREATEAQEAARRQRLNERLGGVAAQEVRPNDN